MSLQLINPNPKVFPVRGPSSSLPRSSLRRRSKDGMDLSSMDCGDESSPSAEVSSLVYRSDEREPLLPCEVFDIVRQIKDPEHPYCLEELHVVTEEAISVQDDEGLDDAESTGYCTVKVVFTPTVPHCTLATLIGLCIRVKLNRELRKACKLDILIKPGAHNNEHEINKQINDKERIEAALENPHLLKVVEECIQDRAW
mmetsp:Transcript_38460/g.96753  ORF Transcript_38460/g.96753 Transcript_38460/m.96753 type:complete len:199 (-) Transcript_38460:3611-4207(-)